MGAATRRNPPVGGHASRPAARWAVAWIAMLLLSWAQPARAGEPTIAASVDPKVIGIEDATTLTITINAGASGVFSRPSLPELDDFEVTATGSSRNMTFVNGHMESSIAYSYTLRPRQKGKLSIPPITVEMGGKNYSTPPLAVEVRDGSLAQRRSSRRRGSTFGDPFSPRSRWDRGRRTGRRGREIDPRDHIEIETAVDRESAVVGQEIDLVFRLATSPEIRFDRQPVYTPPEVQGGWVEELGDETRRNEVRAGVPWEIVEIRYALFPTAPGKLEISPAKLDGVVSASRMDIFSLMSGQGRRLILETDPITVDVSPLPADGRPDNFAGAVGDFTMRAGFDRDRGTVNDPLTLTITIEGRGNLRTLPDPPMPDIEGLRFFEPQATVEKSVVGGHFGGKRTLTRLVVPEKAGTVLFPALDLAYFNPETGRYHHARSSAIRLEILPGEGGDAGPVVSGLSKEEVKRLKSDIEYIYTEPLRLLPRSTPPYRRFGFWALALLPLLLLAGALIWRQRRDRLEQDVGYARSTRAFKTLRRGLAQLRRMPAEDRQVWSFANRLLLDYLGDRFNLNTAGLTTHEATEMIGQAGIPEATGKAIRDFLSSCDLARYAPGGMQVGPSQLADQIEAIAAGIERPNGAATLLSRAAAVTGSNASGAGKPPARRGDREGGKKL